MLKLFRRHNPLIGRIQFGWNVGVTGKNTVEVEFVQFLHLRPRHELMRQQVELAMQGLNGRRKRTHRMMGRPGDLTGELVQ